MAGVDVPVFLGHGASGGPETMADHLAGLRDRGIDARPLALPRRRAEDAVEALVAQLPRDGPVIVGGHSYGGRVASLGVAGPLAGRALALVCLSYPLHRPGGASSWRDRVAHWPAIQCPALLLSGEADPFARIDLLREAVALLPNATLVTYPAVRHGLRPVLSDALDRVAAFVRSLQT